MLEGLDLLSPYGLRTSFYIISSNSVVQLELPDDERIWERQWKKLQILSRLNPGCCTHFSCIWWSKQVTEPAYIQGEENRFLLLLMGGDTKSHSRGAAGWEGRLWSSFQTIYHMSPTISLNDISNCILPFTVSDYWLKILLYLCFDEVPNNNCNDNISQKYNFNT